MSYYVETGNTVRILNDDALAVKSTLPAKTYSVKKCSMTGEYFLETIQPYENTGKIYGNPVNRAKRIINTYQQRNTNLGVLLSGMKGSGKSLLAREISSQCIDIGIPTIVISENHHGDDFNRFMTSIDCRCVVIFDEFEKVYKKGENEQDSVLTLLDGVYKGNKLFILTINDRILLNENLINRPGRIHYFYEYETIDDEVIEEFCADKGVSHFVSSIKKIKNVYGSFNFDMLSAMVSECLMYNETPEETLDHLNIREEKNSYIIYRYFLYKGDEKVDIEGWCSTDGDPLSRRIIEITLTSDAEKSYGIGEVTFNPKSDLKAFDVNDGSLTFESGEYKLVAKREFQATNMLRRYI